MTLLGGVPAALGAALPAEIPSPTVGVWHLGPLPIRGYALCILAGIIVAVWLTQKRLEAPRAPQGRRHRHLRLGRALRHRRRAPLPPHHHAAAVLRPGRRPVEGLRDLRGRPRHLGCRRAGRRRAPGSAAARTASPSATSSTPPLRASRSPRRWAASATGSTTRSTAARPTCRGGCESTSGTPPPAVRSSTPRATPSSRATSTRRSSTRRSGACCSRPSSSGSAAASTLKAGQVFAAYVMGYPIGRIVIENMRTDSANLILGQRVNTWVSILVFLLGVCLWRRFGRMAAARPPRRGRPTRTAPRSSSGRGRRSFGPGCPRRVERHRCQRVEGGPSGAVVTRSAPS